MSTLVCWSNISDESLLPNPTFGEALSLLRRRRKLKLKQLGTKVRLSAAYLSMLERGRSRPTAANVLALSEALGEETNDPIFFWWQP